MYFNPRPPRRGRRDYCYVPALATAFQSTPSAKRATGWIASKRQCCLNFNPRPPRRGRHLLDVERPGRYVISIHALREEGDASGEIVPPVPIAFQSTPSAKRATQMERRMHVIRRFQSTPSAKRATVYLVPFCSNSSISIHALREEGDLSRGSIYALKDSFQSTPSAKRATWCRRPSGTGRKHFNPRPPRRGRLLVSSHTKGLAGFQSTPSAKRATYEVVFFLEHILISIHALREEGDRIGQGLFRYVEDFNPRPPRRGRRCEP